jgi:glycosyltransferase involved in cell wall biosynthesis
MDIEMDEKRISVLFLIPSLQGGGAERVFVSLLRHLDRNKFSLSLAVVDARHDVYRELVPKDVEFIDLDCSRVRQALPKILRLIYRRRPNVVLSTLGHLNLALAIIQPLLPRSVRFVARESIVVSLLSLSYKVPFWWNWAYRCFYKRFDKVICQSYDMKNDLIETFGLPESKTVVINNPVDIQYIRKMAADKLPSDLFESNVLGEGKIHLVAAGRLVHQKGFDLLINALAICRNNNFFVTILGDGEARDELLQLSNDLDVAHQIRFVGFQANPFSIIARADAFVLSSRFEGFPNVILEALACGTPIISTPAMGGVREILSGLDGCLITEDVSAGALANALENFTFGYRVPPGLLKPYRSSFIASQYEQVLWNVGYSDKPGTVSA